MAKLDPYLRSIERFSATGALLASGQAIVMRFPTGDRNATQVTPHDQLVMMVREVAPPEAYAALDAGRPARFEYESQGVRYVVGVTPRPGAWQVTIDGSATGGAAAAGSPPASTATPPAGIRMATPPAGVRTATPPTGVRTAPARAATAAPAEAEPGDMEIERGQYVAPPTSGSAAAAAASGSALLDGLTRAARGARATDLYLSAGVSPLQRVSGDLLPTGAALDAETLSRELGILAPAEARTAWTDGGGGPAVFTYGDGLAVRVTLARDQRGPCAALRLLPDEAPSLDRLNLTAVAPWLEEGGLVLVAGPSGAGKTLVLGAIVRAIADAGRRVVTIEDPIELVQTGDRVSQRAVREHVATVATGITGAMAEGADAIAIAGLHGPEAVRAVVEAVAGGHLVVVTVVAASASSALDRVLAQLPGDARDGARAVLGPALLGIVRPVASREGRRYEVVPGAPRNETLR